MTVQTKTAEELRYLLSCALTEMCPQKDRVESMDFAAMEQLAKFHSVSGIAAATLERFWKQEPDVCAEQKDRWMQIRGNIIRCTMLVNMERQQILQELEQRKIWYMPLKGVIMQELYPGFGMRQMADNDILFDPARRQDVQEVMISRAYHLNEHEESSDDQYFKAPFYCFEMHHALFEELYGELCSYYDNVEEKLLADDKNEYCKMFRDEDFYIYLIVHAYKHYQLAGTGIRSLTDCFVYTRKKAAALDWAYIEQELSKLGALQFEQQCRRIAEKLFTSPDEPQPLSEEEKSFVDFLWDSGAMGSKKNSVRNQINAITGESISWKTKLRYTLSRLFPNMEYISKYYPWFAKNPWAIPFLWVFRFMRLVFMRPEKLRQEVEAVYQAEKKDIL